MNTPVSYRCLQSSCLLRLCFTHLPHGQALFHAPDKFQERTFSYSRLWALGSECLLGHQTILMVKPFKNNGSERRSRRTPRQPHAPTPCLERFLSNWNEPEHQQLWATKTGSGTHWNPIATSSFRPRVPKVPDEPVQNVVGVRVELSIVTSKRSVPSSVATCTWNTWIHSKRYSNPFGLHHPTTLMFTTSIKALWFPCFFPIPGPFLKLKTKRKRDQLGDREELPTFVGSHHWQSRGTPARESCWQDASASLCRKDCHTRLWAAAPAKISRGWRTRRMFKTLSALQLHVPLPL